MDKAKLTEYDSIVCIDRSGSMSAATKRFPSRWLEAREMTMGIGALAAEVDEDGITLIMFGGNFKENRDVLDNKKGADITDAFDNNSPSGTTPLHAALNAAFNKKFTAGKKAIVFVITDGVPDDVAAVRKSIVDATAKLNDASELRVLFVQVGDDPEAKKFLNSLDNSLDGAKFDIVNAIDFEGANDLTPMELFDRAVNDSH